MFPPGCTRFIRFASFQLDLRAGELRRNGVKVRLPDQSINVLALLVENPGEVVTREELQRKLWPNGTIVEFDRSINAAIKRLRQALEDSAEQPRFIETLPRRGYRFLFPVEREAPPEQVRASEPGPEAGTPAGQAISHYRIVRKLGQGAMGVVYQAEDTRLGRSVALKFLPEELAQDHQALERFAREARAASALNHPNICTLYDIGETDGRPFLVMEYLDGQTLADSIAAKPLCGDELVDLGIQIADALEAAHAKRIIHRDVKPANIFITTRGQVKIMDFGVAKLANSGPLKRATLPGSEEVTATLSEQVMTNPGTALGTVAYMSPEQVRGEDLDTRSDLFSFGVVLYEMATGQRPFQGATSAAVFLAILSQAPPSLAVLRLHLPGAMEHIINKALEKDRKLRYQSAAEMRADLQRLKRDIGSGAALSTRPTSGNHFVKWAVIAATVAVTVGFALSVWLHYPRTALALTEADTIVLADFANSTGDAVFDDTLKQALATELQQSPFLSILPDRKVNETLKLMGRSVDQHLDEKTALDLCQRAGSKAVLSGSIANLGSEYVIGLNAIGCQTGGSLARDVARATKKENVLDAVGKTATKLRAKLGESLSTVQRFDTPLQQATTPSLEALQAYSLGRKNLIGKADSVSAARFFERAIRLDSNFAMAYLSLGLCYVNVGETSLGAQNIQRAYELRARVSEWEKYAIESRYYNSVVGDLTEARQIYAVWAQTYPREAIALGCLAEIDSKLGQYDKAVAENREAMRLDPNSASHYGNLAGASINLGRLEDAQAVIEEARKRNYDSSDLRADLYTIDFLRGDAAGMTQQVAWSSGKPGIEDILIALEADTAAFYGRLRKSRDLARQAVASAQRAQETDTAAGYYAQAALREALVGNADEARQYAGAALALSKSRDVEFAAAQALAFTGDAVRADALAKDLATHFPKDTIVQFNYLPAIQAQLSMSANRASTAVQTLQAAATYELGSAPGTSIGVLLLSMYPVYVRGEAHMAAHEPSLAATEFQKILQHPGIVANEPIAVMAHLGLARAYALSGDTARAKAQYQGFLTLWKDADPDVPILRQAKAEYARLH